MSKSRTINIPQRIVNVLGTEYQIIFKSEMPEGLKESELGKIVLEHKWIILEDADNDRWIRGADHHKQILTHELIHAFLFESGLEAICRDEQIVNWIAIQFPKILNTVTEAERVVKRRKQGDKR